MCGFWTLRRYRVVKCFYAIICSDMPCDKSASAARIMWASRMQNAGKLMGLIKDMIRLKLLKVINAWVLSEGSGNII